MSAFNNVDIKLEKYSFHVVAAAFDGAGENRSFAKTMLTIPASELLNGAEVSFDASTLILMPHPVWGKEYVIILFGDGPQVWKKLANALEFSNANDWSRSLQMLATDGESKTLCLEMCRDAWVQYEGIDDASPVAGTGALRRSIFKEEHFKKNAFSRMRVPLAVQVISQRMIEVLHEYVGDDAQKQLLFEPLINFCDQMDRFVDICNSRRARGYDNIRSLNNSRELRELDVIVAWFEKWYTSIQTAPQFQHLTPDEKKDAFWSPGTTSSRARRASSPSRTSTCASCRAPSWSSADSCRTSSSSTSLTSASTGARRSIRLWNELSVRPAQQESVDSMGGGDSDGADAIVNPQSALQSVQSKG
mmetsp:Transcript_11300/g.45756  ORF Transcript_11300/g.45756 Transcript_11300/m.45756 type:complete len:361 (-) Transcript_11300:60-1142(-)